MSDDDLTPKTLDPAALDDDWRDRLAALGKGVAGAIPIAGGLVSELVGGVIPDQRADRIATYLRALSSKVEKLEAEVRASIVTNAEKIDLIEEGGFQSTRATSGERLDQIVEAVSRGLSEDDAEVVRRKRLLRTLGEIDDDEISILNAYGRLFGTADRHAFDGVMRPNPTHMQSTPAEMDSERLYELGKSHLIQLGLLEKNFGILGRGEIPEFDAREGDFKHRLEVSYLGRMLLREIGMETPFDAHRRSGQNTDRS